MDPVYFAGPAEFRAWLKKHHRSAQELQVGFRKKHTGQPSIDWPQARDQALCFGWIDGVRHSLGEDAYMIRFTPRRSGSKWSKVNVERFHALTAEGAMTAAGERAFEAGKDNPTGYAYESEVRELEPGELALFRENRAAWADWERRPPSYRKVALHWITSARKPETRARRLAVLIEDSAAGRKIAGVDIARRRGEA